jgi:hypothetical protein
MSPQPGRKKLSRAEAARHASLVRWKKESPFAANVQERLAQIRAARVKKGRGGKGKGKGKAAPKKPAQTPEQRKAEKAQAQAQQRETTLKESGLGEDARASLDDIMAGRDVEDDGGLEKLGLAERDKEGKLRLTSAGRAAHRAAGRGDAGTVKDALSKGKEGVGKKAERDKAKAERLAKQKQRKEKRAKAKPAPKEEQEKPDPDRAKREQERTADRAQRQKEHAEDRAAAQTDRAQRQKEHAEDRAERAKDRAEQRKQRAEDRAARQKERASKQPPAPKPPPRQTARKAMDDLTPILDDMQATIAELADLPEIKAGRRNSTSDQAQIDAGYEMAMQLCDIFEGLGADTGEEAGEEMGMEEEMGEMEGKSSYMLDGDAVKALDGDRVGALAIRFGSADEPDMSQMRDFFTKSTDFWLDAWDRRPMLYHHAMDEDTSDAPRIGTWTKAEIKDEGVWLEGQLDRSHRYYSAIKELVRRGALRLSSDSAPHLVRRAVKGDTHEVTRWPLLAASLTPTPAEPRLTAVSFKTLMAELGLDAIDNPGPPDQDDLKAVELELIEIEREKTALLHTRAL